MEIRQYGKCGIIRAMKATIQIPDEMYREVKAKSAGHSPFFCGDTRQSEAAWSRDRLLTPTIGIHKAIRA